MDFLCVQFHSTIKRLKLFSNKIDKVVDISLLDNEEDVLSISIGLNA